ncbi:sugar kinase [Mucilaginibacter pedocola]|uniref:Carbohydrate kinase n=1 Tax=Mucilaginibacter pedocola TaxID=1792845 RepID=A0A1S9PAW8_9SPHI|nr:sugar kinase [Mucilaginibacter pedocola]OOQ57738.1 carbohydrate kinase [Mucilaginibacter pedocola]
MSILTFGELMLRLTPALSGDKLAGSSAFGVNYAGSESNVASSLAVLGNAVQFVTKLPDNPLGDGAIRSLRSYGIDTSLISRGGERLGTYFIELGASIRPSRVVYDRKHSAFSEIAPGEFNWAEILKGKSWLFVSGITPAVSANCAAEAIAMVKEAKRMNVKVAFDFNYRRTLWNDRADARVIFDEILAHTDLLLGNAGSLLDVYDVQINGSNEEKQAEHGLQVAAETFGLKQVAFTIREHTSASQNKLGAVYLNNGKVYHSANYTVDIADRFGTGDAFAAGMLHGLAHGWSDEKCVAFAGAAFALKHTIYGDQHTSTEQEIIAIMEGNTSGHVIR